MEQPNTLVLLVDDEPFNLEKLAEHLEHGRELIFDTFAQSGKIKSKAGETGLGLAICREIAAAHRGVIFASSNAPEGGACLTI